MRRLFALPYALLLTLPFAARAQSSGDLASYFGSTFSTPGAAAVVAEQPLLGDTLNTWGLAPFYTHETFGDFGTVGTLSTVSANVFGGSLYGSFLAGRLGVTATGGYVNPSCPSGIECKGFATAGGDALFRVLRAPVGSDSSARFTMALRVAGGWAFAPDSDTYAAASVGIPLALSGPEGGYRIVGFLTPGLAWGKLKTLVLNDAQDALVVFDHSGTRAVLSGGLAFVPSRSGVGIHAGFQRIFVDHAGTQYSLALSWNMPRLGER